jgi:hypothetical protein
MARAFLAVACAFICVAFCHCWETAEEICSDATCSGPAKQVHNQAFNKVEENTNPDETSLLQGMLQAGSRLSTDARAGIHDAGNDVAKQVETLARTQANGPTQSAWDNHFSAFGSQDLKKIMLDYVEESVAVIHDMTTGSNAKFAGLAGIREMFTELFAELDDLSDLAAPVVKVEEGPIPQVFLVWENPASGIVQATDTFAFDKMGKIIRQNIVLWRAQPLKLPFLDLNMDAKDTPTQVGWDNHFAAFAEQNVTKILLDYNDQSEINIYNWVTKEQTLHTGSAEIGTMFAGLFKALHDNSQLAAPVVRVEHKPVPQVFLIWESPASGFLKVTDSFLFDDNGKIIRQNIVIETSKHVLEPLTYVALVGGRTGKHCADETHRIICNRPWLRSWERFEVVDAGNGKVGLKGGRQKRMCADEDSGIKCNRNWLRSWEKFTVMDLGRGQVALKGGKNGKFCTDTDTGIICNQDDVFAQGQFTQFTVIPIGPVR